MKQRIMAVLVAVGIALSAQALPPGFRVEPCGSVEMAGLKGLVVFYGTGFQRNVQIAKTVRPDPGYPVCADLFFELQGRFQLRSGDAFQLKQKWEEDSNGNVLCMTDLQAAGNPIPGMLLCFTLELPVAEFSARKLILDGSEVEMGTWTRDKVKSVSIPCGARTLTATGDFKLALHDNRGYEVPSYSLRFCFSPDSGNIGKASFRAAFRIDESDQKPVALDAAAGTGKTFTGGEAEKLLRSFGMPKGEFKRGALFFHPGAVLRLGAGQSLSLPVSGSGRFLYLLHNADSAEARPRLEIEFADGGRKVLELRDGVDFSTGVDRLPNGALAAADTATKSGLYVSRFDVGSGAGWKTLTVSNSGHGGYTVAAAIKGGADVNPAKLDSILFLRENDEWRPTENVGDVKPGSILDFSQWTDAPAGKFGRVIVDPAGHFVFENAPEKRIRFLGANVVGAGNFVDKENARRLIDNMATVGYNTLRLHHFDGRLAKVGGKNSLDFDPEQLDKLDYLFAEAKRRGLYVTIDLYSARRPDVAGISPGVFKEVVPVHPGAFENWKAYARKLLGHVNPYTGLAWGKDPALFSLSLLNEHAPFQGWEYGAERGKIYAKAYADYLREKGVWSEARAKERGADFYRFLRDANVKFTREATDFLRNEVGYRGLITNVNHRNQLVNAELRELLDFVDLHQYWDHPKFMPGQEWGLPVLHNQMSSLAAGVWCPRTIFHSRIFGKPYTVTEYNYTFPNRYRAEVGPLFGGLASLQDWDGLYRYSWWGHMQDQEVHRNPINRFDIAEDSLSLLSERLIWALFVRGDASPATPALAWPYGESMYAKWTELGNNVPPLQFQELGFNCRIGLLREGKTLPGVQTLSPENYRKELPEKLLEFSESAVRRSATGQLVIEPDSCTVVTPKTESLVLSKGDRAGSLLRVEKADSFQVVSALAMDEAPLVRSGKILLFHQSDVLNRNIRFANASCQTVEHWGDREPLIRRATALVRLRLRPGVWEVRAVGLDGAPRSVVPSAFKDGELSFPIDTARDGGTMVYQITQKKGDEK